jgi:DNA-binding winged helix-turn-helix (wHTH) protein
MLSADRTSSNVGVNPVRVRFGSFEYDTSNGELRREGMLMHLQAQPAKVLSHLLLHAGGIVSRDDLHNAIWGNETFVDFERGLNVCIAQIRSILGDESTSPRFIRTVPRRGYQFVCPVERLPVATPSEPDEIPGRPKGPRRVLFATLVLVLVALLIVISANWRQIVPTSSPPAIIAVAEFDNETGDAALNSFCRSLRDNVVQQLTDAGRNHFAVIGNAAVLSVPREQRDLRHIANSLGAQYIILGQVQGSGTQTRILAHLIHMPEQTHVWVVRLEQPFDDPFTLESTAAHDIATEFAQKLEQHRP